MVDWTTFQPSFWKFLSFLDGNGRLGRLLITLPLCKQKVLREPMLYLSLYFKTHRQFYYELLTNVRLTGDGEAWLDFFAEAFIATATQAVDTSRQLIDLASEDRERISSLGRAASSILQVHRAMMERPITDFGWLVKKTGITPATVNKCLGHLERLGIADDMATGAETLWSAADRKFTSFREDGAGQRCINATLKKS